jgi:RecG-like helicase
LFLGVALVDDNGIMRAYEGTTKETKMNTTNTVTATVTIASVTEFERENTHVKLQWPERFVAIAMTSEDKAWAVTFTRKHSKFADSVKVGDTLTVTGVVKRTQDHANLGGQIVLTNCVVGVPASIAIAAKRAAKVAARKAALFG